MTAVRCETDILSVSKKLLTGMPSLAESTLSKRDARRHWPAEDIRLLGQAPDRDFAWRLGRSEGAVMQMRGKLRIAKFNARLRRWTTEEDHWLRTIRNQDFSRRFNRTVAAIQQRRYDLGIAQPKREHPWTGREDALLGKMSDPDFARQFGRPQISISPRRRQLGIPAFNPRPSHGPKSKTNSWAP